MQLYVTVASYGTCACTLQVPVGAYLLLHYCMRIILYTFTYLPIEFGDLINQEPAMNKEIQICLTSWE